MLKRNIYFYIFISVFAQAGQTEVLAVSNPGVSSTSLFPKSQGQRPSSQTQDSAKSAAAIVNSYRRYAGLQDLQLDPALNRAALLYAQELHRRGVLTHQGEQGDVSQRLRILHIPWRAVGENIASGYRDPQSVVQGWMSSAGHRANILAQDQASRNFRRQGIAEYGGYWVQIFTD